MSLVPPSQTPRTVDVTGARPGCVLSGAGWNNQGLRIRVLQLQARSTGGPVVGQFQILDTGNNVHAGALRPLLGQVTDAAAVLRLIRRERHQCVSVVNTRLLVVEGGGAATAAQPAKGG